MPGSVLPELARVAAGAGHRHPADDQAAADAAGAAVEVDDVVDSARCAEQVLGDRSEHRVVADGGRHARRIGHEIANGGIDPSQVRGVAHESVGRADEPRHGESDPRHPRPREFVATPLRTSCAAIIAAVSSGVIEPVDLDAGAHRDAAIQARPPRW